MMVVVTSNGCMCFELCDILRLQLTGYVDKLNLHIMNDSTLTRLVCR